MEVYNRCMYASVRLRTDDPRACRPGNDAEHHFVPVQDPEKEQGARRHPVRGRGRCRKAHATFVTEQTSRPGPGIVGVICADDARAGFAVGKPVSLPFSFRP